MNDKRNIIIPEEPDKAIKPDPEPEKLQVSDYFNAAICDSSSLVVTCEFCDRTYFGGDGDFEEGERERLEEQAEAEPGKYFAMGDYTRWGYLCGKQYVIDCECNAAAKYEAWIWSHRHLIADYLKTRSMGELEDAKRDAKLLGNINVK